MSYPYSLIVVLAAALAAGCSPPANSETSAGSDPGKRPDLKPSSLEFWSSLESKTLEQIRKVKQIDTEMEAASERRTELTSKHSTAEVGPWWSPFDDEKTKIGNEIDRLEARVKELETQRQIEGSRLQDYLASTPGERTAPTQEWSEYRLNKEAVEIRNSLENLRALGKRLVAELKANPKDTKKAVECYDSQLRALGYVQLMHMEFSRRCKEEYPKYLDDLEKATEKFIRKQREVLMTFGGEPDDAAIIERTVAKAQELQQRFPVLRTNIDEMRKWSDKNLEQVRYKKTVLDSLKGSAEIMDRAKDIASSVSTAFSELSFEEPPLVEFEFDPSSLDMDSSKGEKGIQ